MMLALRSEATNVCQRQGSNLLPMSYEGTALPMSYAGFWDSAQGGFSNDFPEIPGSILRDLRQKDNEFSFSCLLL